MCEATDLMNKMKNTPGMGNIENIMNNMASSMMGKGAKFNMNAFNQKTKANSQKERMLQELERRRAQNMQNTLETNDVKTGELQFSKYTPNDGNVVKSGLTGPNNDDVQKDKPKKKRKNKKRK